MKKKFRVQKALNMSLGRAFRLTRPQSPRTTMHELLATQMENKIP